MFLYFWFSFSYRLGDGIVKVGGAWTVSIKMAFWRLLGKPYQAYFSFDLGRVVDRASGVVVEVGGCVYGSVPVVCRRGSCEEVVECAEFVPSSVKFEFVSPVGGAVVEAYGDGETLAISGYVYGRAKLRIVFPHPDFPGEKVASFLFMSDEYKIVLKLSPPSKPSRFGLWGCGSYNIVLRFGYGHVEEREAHISLVCRLKRGHAIFAVKPIGKVLLRPPL